ncbi:MAG: DUF1801 domain-containing protein [Chloroflexi bacterium]|nr:DUF1801 domain-containing protein [Chloroflexota bacterium]
MKQSKQNVDEFMERLDHPFKAEIEAIREILLGVSPCVTEQIKWNAPSFRYRDTIATFNLHAQDYVHLVFHNPFIAGIRNDILEGHYPDRRMVYFSDMSEVYAKKPALERVVMELIAHMDRLG